MTTNSVLTPVERLVEYAYVFVGTLIVAIAFNVLLLPNQIASGGVSGLSTITEYVFHWEPAIVQLLVNLPLFFAGVMVLGKQFGVKTLIATMAFPVWVYMTKWIEPFTLDPLLGAIFGGIGVGMGLGLTFRGRASTGGTDLAAQMIHKFTGLTFGTSVSLVDGLIVLTAAIVFNIEYALYALIALFITGKTIDIVQVGLGHSKMTLIITKKEYEVRQTISEKINRGVTKISGLGGYTNDERPILMCVVRQREFTKLKQLVKSIDSAAFVIVMDASEVLGEGFKRG